MNELEKEFVLYDEAQALKELGFNQPCLGIYYSKDGNVRRVHSDEKGDAPLYQQAFRWFREKYGLHRHICYFEETKVWHVDIYKLLNNSLINSPMELTNYSSYEEAELACLRKLIEIVKNNEQTSKL